MVEPALRERSSAGEASNRYSSAREIRRIVDVAEATEIDPQIARIALQGENGVVSTDCPLRRAVSIVQEALNPGS
jgi:hypothetical protein